MTVSIRGQRASASAGKAEQLLTRARVVAQRAAQRRGHRPRTRLAHAAVEPPPGSVTIQPQMLLYWYRCSANPRVAVRIELAAHNSKSIWAHAPPAWMEAQPNSACKRAPASHSLTSAETKRPPASGYRQPVIHRMRVHGGSSVRRNTRMNAFDMDQGSRASGTLCSAVALSNP